MSVTVHQALNTIGRADRVDEEVQRAIYEVFGDTKPTGESEEQRAAYVKLALIETAKTIVGAVPGGADRNNCIKMLRDIRRICNEAIAMGGGY